MQLVLPGSLVLGPIGWRRCSPGLQHPPQKKGDPRLPVPCTVMGWQSPDCPPAQDTVQIQAGITHKGSWPKTRPKLAKHKCMEKIWGLSDGPARKTTTIIILIQVREQVQITGGWPGKSQWWKGTGGMWPHGGNKTGS